MLELGFINKKNLKVESEENSRVVLLEFGRKIPTGQTKLRNRQLLKREGQKKKEKVRPLI